jgi:hypothetical protein
MPKMADKVARVLSSGLPSMMRQLNVLVKKDEVWREDMASEVGLFPFASHDDQVDCLAFAAWYINELPNWKPKKERPVPSFTEEIEEHALKAAKTKRGGRRDNWAMAGRSRR